MRFWQLSNSCISGNPVPKTTRKNIFDGILHYIQESKHWLSFEASAPGDSLCSHYVDEIVTVSEDEICAAILQLLESEKMVAEGAGAASVAAVMYNKVPVKGKKTICVVSGGNIDVTILNRVINRGLVKSGRLCTIEMELDDKPLNVLLLVANIIHKIRTSKFFSAFLDTDT